MRKTKVKTKKAKKVSYGWTSHLLGILFLSSMALFIFVFVKQKQMNNKIIAESESHQQESAQNDKDKPSTSPSNQPQPTQGPATGAHLLFDSTSKNLKVGDQFDAKISVDTFGNESLSTDAYVVYDTTMLQPVIANQGDFFPSINTNILSSSVVLRGIVTEPADFRKGVGLLGTIKFKALKNGTTTLKFYCDPVAGDTSKIVQNNIDAPNIINCGDNTSITINIGSTGTTISPNATTTVKPSNKTPTPTKKPSEDNTKKLIAALIILIFVILMIILGL